MYQKYIRCILVNFYVVLSDLLFEHLFLNALYSLFLSSLLSFEFKQVF